jgi:DNA modification methylase
VNVDSVVQCGAVALLEQFDDNSVPLIIADPPYGIGYHSNHYKGKNPHSPVANDWNFQIYAFIQECERVLTDGGALYLFSRWDVYPLWLPTISGVGLEVKTKIVWVKNNWSAGDLDGCFGNQYEEILFIVKGRHLLRDKRWPNVWEFDRIPSTQMLVPTQKPTSLLRRAITSSSNLGDLVLDPFCGSGSTGEAAMMEGRNYLLGDIDPKMVYISCARLGLPLPEGGETDTPQGKYSFELPDPSMWGIHPEELRYIYDALQGNVRRSLKNAQMELL